MDIPANIFKKYDIRGKASGDGITLTTDIAYQVGQGIATYFLRMEQVEKVVVGRDNRHSSFALQEGLMDGLQRGSMKITDIGLVSTPLVYWHAVQRGNIGGIMVTGSHLEPDYNGFKICVGSRNIYDAGIRVIARFIADKNFAYGGGSATTDNSAYSQYIHDVAKRIQIPRKLKIVIDPGNGTGGIFAPRLLQLWGQEAIGIFIEPDGDYPNHQPDPQAADNLKMLAAKVRETNADVGIAFDGDVDRIGVVDEKGSSIAADRILALLAQDMLRRNPGAVVVGDVLCSQVVFDTVARSGGIPFMAASGHSIVKDAMREQAALLGGEMSGHIFLGEDYFGFDDGYMAMGRLLQVLANSGNTMSELNNALPHLYSTPEYRPHCPEDAKDRVIYGVHQALLGKGIITDVDGIRVQFEHGWGLLRASNTEPVLSLRFEAATETEALAYRDLFAAALAKFPEVEKLF